MRQGCAVRSEHSIAAAIYFAARGRVDIAESILSAAIDLRPSLAHDADRLAYPFIDSVRESAPPPAIGIDL